VSDSLWSRRRAAEAGRGDRDRLGKVAVEIGNNIAERVQVDVKFEWQV
jgi:hypothetical protein